MGIGSANPLLLASAAADDSDPVTRSLRFDSGDSPSVYNSFSSDGSNGSTQKFTFSGWVKIANTSYVITWGNSSGYWDYLMFFNGKLRLVSDGSGGTGERTAETSAVFRDNTAWMHMCVVVDVTQSSNADCIKIFVNGVQQSLTFSGSSFVGTGLFYMNSAGEARFARGPYTTNYSSGILADLYFIDGSAVTPVGNFIQDTGYNSYKPKSYNMSSHTGNSFHLKFEDSSDIGADSANSNDFSTSNVSGPNDQLLDTPTTSYPVINPLDKASTTHLSDGNLVIQPTGAGTGAAFHASMPFPESGKWYYEVTVDTVGTGSSWVHLTFGKERHAYDLSAGGFYFYRQDGDINGNSNTSFSNGSVIGVAYDADNNTLTYYHDGTQQHQFTSVSTSHKWWAGGMVGNAGGSKLTANFGQKDFSQTVPTGFEAFNTSKLDDPTVKAHENFGVLTYTGNDTDNTSITGLDFQPNFTWIKQRSNSSTSHFLHDSERTQGSPTSLWNYLKSNSNSAESWDSDQFDGFLTNGFKISSNGNSDDINKSSRTYVAWNWKENASAGFDIVTWTGANVTAGSYATVSHSLGVVPEMVIAKPRTNLGQQMGYHPDWIVHHVDLGTGGSGYKKFLRLDSNGAALEAGNEGTAGLIDSLTTTNFRAYNEGSSSASYYMNWGYQGNDEDYIAYLFASVDGVCKVGSYTGNASSDGPFVYCGFRPAFLLMKNANASGSHWFMVDSKRDPDNKVHTILEAETSDSDNVLSTEFVDFLSTGFKVRNSGSYENGSGDKIIFLAMAESPLKYANAR